MAIRRVANLLLCIYANDTVGLGLLKAKVRVILKPLHKTVNGTSLF